MALSRLRKFVRLEPDERRLLLRTVFTLAAARVAIWVLPFKYVRQLITPRPRVASARAITRDQVRWAVGLAQRVIPDATCLPQAVTAESLLTRGGHPVKLRIGVLKSAAGKLEAHAWAESDGQVIVGDLPWGLDEYTRLPPLPDVWPEQPASRESSR